MAEKLQDNTFSLNPKQIVIGAQMLFVAFGALVLVPLLTGLNANVALFTAGAGTLVFQLVTRGKVPVFLASSFAFIAPIIYGVQQWGIPGTMCGLAAAGLLYVAISLGIRVFGSDILHRILPPVVTVRPENLKLGEEGENAIQARVRSQVYVGTHTRFRVQSGELEFEIVAEASSVECFKAGDVVPLRFPSERIWLVPPEV